MTETPKTETPMTETIVYAARKVITMNPRQPVTSHVAVRDGHILGTGSLDDLAGWGPYTLDEQFADKVLMPGLVEGHSHLSEGSFWQDPYVGYYDRLDPNGVVHKGLDSIEGIVERLSKIEKSMDDPEQPLMAWGMDPIFYRDDRRMTTADLDQVSTTRAVMIVHASGHIINANTALMTNAGITRSLNIMGVLKGEDGEPTGELQGPPLRYLVFETVGKERYADMAKSENLFRFAASARFAGVTTATDLANDLPPDAVESMLDTTKRDDYSLRIVPAFVGMSRPAADGAEYVKSLIPKSHDKLRFGLVKLVADGSIQGFTARLKWPGYYNGHENGLWYIEPDELPRLLGTYHAAGLQVHIHTNGDQATEVTIDAIEQVLRDHPAPDARFTLQHCQMAHDAHYRRMARLGICANIFSNHLYYWGDQHYALTMGPERSLRLDAAGTAQRLGVSYAIHSDAPVTHLGPLFTAWCAVNRKTSSGRVLGEAEKLTVDQALYAITLGAAFTLKLDHEIGSLETGKRADMAILEDDPLTIGGEKLKDVRVWGTMLSGKIFANPEITSS